MEIILKREESIDESAIEIQSTHLSVTCIIPADLDKDPAQLMSHETCSGRSRVGFPALQPVCLRCWRPCDVEGGLERCVGTSGTNIVMCVKRSGDGP